MKVSAAVSKASMRPACKGTKIN